VLLHEQNEGFLMPEHNESAPRPGQSTIAYTIGKSLYLNITNRCSNICTFCPKFDDYVLKGNDLLLESEPTYEEVMADVGEPMGIDEIVFCGFGESLLRLDLVVRVALELKKCYGYRIRINTDGQANLVYGRNILPELVGRVDCISVSMNAHDSATYRRLCNTPFGDAGFHGVCDFIREANKVIPLVIASVVTVPEVDVEACRAVAESLGALFRIREFTGE
jgi:TatD DNase family protein